MSTLDVPAAADFFGISEDTVRDWARRGIIPAAKLGKEWRFVEAQLQAHIETKAQQNVKVCPSISVRARPIGGADSRSVVERFAKAPGLTKDRKRRSTKPVFAVVTGGKAS